jgi:hypothetical protein
MHRKKKQRIIQGRRDARRRKKETSAVKRASAHAIGRILRRRAKGRQRVKARFWKEKLEPRSSSRNTVKERGQTFGFFEDENLQRNPALQYFSEVMNLFKDRLPSKEFPRF